MKTIVSVLIMIFIVCPLWAESNASGGGYTPLSLEEAEHLTYMREEEKMARDVYLLMYDTWNFDTFSSIADSEQTHMDTMLIKLVKYHLPDPVGDNDKGEFTNLYLQDLYNDLVGIGINSLVAGLDVGAIIEETDMIDIQEAIDHTDHADVVNAYQNLLDGSKNHLRAFVKALETQGVSYVPKLISQEFFDEIMEEQ